MTLLCETQIKQAKPKCKRYMLKDGHGLLLEIEPNGSKHWQFRYYFEKKQKHEQICLVRYPEMNLKKVRSKCYEIMELILQGINPKKNDINKPEITFAEFATR